MATTPMFRSKTGPVVLVIAGLLLVVGLTQSANSPQPADGPAGSSYATHAGGTAALVDLLEANGYSVARERRPLAEHPPGPDDTLVLVNGRDLTEDDAAAIRGHLNGGGRVVTMGSTWLDGIVASAPTEFGRTTAPSAGIIPGTGFDAVRAARGDWVWADPGSLLPVVGNNDGTLVGVENVGAGIIVAIADESIAANARIDQADNALLSLLAIGERDGTVRFIEYIHGFTQPTGLAALPTRWKQALLVLALAGVVWLVARGRRFGPPEAESRALAPPRSAYLDAVALTLEAAGDATAAAALDDAISVALARRGAALDSATSMVETAVRSGADRAVAEAALNSGQDALPSKAALLSRIVNKEQL